MGSRKTIEDAEALTRKDGYVYVVGSHFGKKVGPLQPKRGFIACFEEAKILNATDDPAAEIEVARPSFVLHRVINDAFEETIRVDEKKGKKWPASCARATGPLNIEDATFRPGGSLLIGLRFPMSANGRPVLVNVEGIESLFEKGLLEARGKGILDRGRRGP